MNNTQKIIKQLTVAINHWLQSDNNILKKAIDQTVAENLFSIEDIKHQILHLKKSLSSSEILLWAEKSGLIANCLSGKKVLCLHAGNLPLVGLQDLLAVILTGAEYVGKISKKDPYLLPSFIESCRQNGLLKDSQWNTILRSLRGAQADCVLFTGSEDTSIKVDDSLKKFQLAKPGVSKLMRTAHFSIAYITNNRPETMEDLTEAVFRYGGTGCRSVSLVVAPFHLNSQKCEFTDYIESFWLKNPQRQKPSAGLFQRYAANKALGIQQAWLDDFLLEESIEYPDQPFILHWVKGGLSEVKLILDRYSDGLQSVYTNDVSSVHPKETKMKFENLSQAQTPPIWWKPDNVDTIAWLQENIS